MSSDPNVHLREASADDEPFIVEMARHACINEDWPLPEPDDDGVLSLLPSPDEATIIAENRAALPVGAVWTFHNDPPLLLDGVGMSLPELCIAVAPGWRGTGIGGVLLDALFIRCATTVAAMCANVHVRNPSQRLYQRKKFRMVGQGRGPLGLAMHKDLRPHHAG